MALSSSVLELGQRTRKRLEERRSKRAEIVVLEQPLPARATTKPSAATAPRLRAAPTQPQQPIHVVEKSSVVRLKGLPKNCTPEMIRRFFSGLQPDRLVILPTFDVAVQEWGESRICRDRVLVKFPSSLIAVAASQRSNEYIVLEGGKKLAITVSIVPKAIGNYLLQNLAIDGIPGESLRKRREITESKSLQSILNLLWTLAIRELKLTSVQDWIQDSSYPWKQTAFHNNGLQEYCNALGQELNGIERAGAVWQLEAGDPQVVNAVVQLYEIGRKQLEKEIDTATNMILMTRYEQSR